MIKKLFLYTVIIAGAFLVGVALYDTSILIGLTNRASTFFTTGLPTFAGKLTANPVATIAGSLAVAAPTLTIGKIVWDKMQAAKSATFKASQQIDMSNKTIEDANNQVTQIKTEYVAKTEEQMSSLKESLELTTKLQLENERLKRENETLKTQYAVLYNDHKELKEGLAYKKVVA